MKMNVRRMCDIFIVLVSDFYSIFNQRWDSSVKNWFLSSWDISVKKSNNFFYQNKKVPLNSKDEKHH